MPLRLLSILVSFPSVIFLLLSGLAMVLGSLQPPNPALAGFVEDCEGKPQPCWNGIVPSVTTVEEAQRILENMSYVCVSAHHLCTKQDTGIRCPSVAWWGYENQLTGLELLDCEELRLGSVMFGLGSPDRIVRFCDGFVYVIWDDFAMLTVYLKHNTRLWFTPTYPVSDITIGPPQFNFEPDHPFSGSVYTWHGFLPYHSYVQFQPDPTCIPLE